MLQALYPPSDEKCDFQIKDRLSFQRFLGLGLDGTVPDATTIWLFRERLVKARAIDRLFARFDAALKDRGYLAMGGLILEATILPAPRQRNTLEEGAAIKEGRVPDSRKTAQTRQKDRDALWTVKYTSAKVEKGAAPGTPKQVDLAIPMFDYKNHVGIDRAHGLIRTWKTSAANDHVGARLPDLVSRENTASGVWADTAYCSKKNEAVLVEGMSPAKSIKRSRRGGRCRSTSLGPTRSVPLCALRSSTFSPAKSIGCACLSAPSASPMPASRSAWPTLPITWAPPSTLDISGLI